MPISTSTRLTAQQEEQFKRDGYFSPLQVLDDSETDRYLQCFMQYRERNKERVEALAAKEKYRVFSETHFVLPWVYEIVSHPKVLDAVECLLGPNLLAWNTNWFAKMPGEKTYVSMHQDGTYWNLRPANVVTAWVALSPSTPENGGMRVIPGTHQQPYLPQRETDSPDNALSRGQEIAVVVDEGQAVDMALQPGQMSLHHIWIIHGSAANASSIPRIGIAIRYVTPEVVQDSPGRPVAILVRGQDDRGNFELAPPPVGRRETDLAQMHTEIIDRIRASVLLPEKQ
ncbi:MAG: phytanoyl-CoA dioxygenase family protein [Acidobacteria bacterium]|nr:phytanoyl-CoA dioxygenase family protein [Acidobacteriota bacterium]